MVESFKIQKSDTLTLCEDFYCLAFYGYYYDTDDEHLNVNEESIKASQILNEGSSVGLVKGKKLKKSEKYMIKKRLDRNSKNLFRLIILFVI